MVFFHVWIFHNFQSFGCVVNPWSERFNVVTKITACHIRTEAYVIKKVIDVMNIDLYICDNCCHIHVLFTLNNFLHSCNVE